MQCCECKAWQHHICCLFNEKKNVDEQTEYVCLICNMKKIEKGDKMTLPECCMLISAQHLPTCRLSDYLQSRLSSRLIEERHERAKNLGMLIEEVVVYFFKLLTKFSFTCLMFKFMLMLTGSDSCKFVNQGGCII